MSNSNSSSVITNPITNIPKNEKSHVHGWTQVWRDHLGGYIDHKCTPKILDANKLYIDHGANFGGTLNLFGGATKEVFNRINLVASHSHIVSLDHDMPDFGEMLKKRIGAPTTYEGITEEWCDALSKRLSTVKSLKQEDLLSDGVILGDSHTIAFSDVGDSVYRNDGKTLHGALKAGLKNMLRGVEPENMVTLCFGSIDIRHHILRQENYDLGDLIRRYIDQGSEIEDLYGVSTRYAFPVPVEFEGRRIPKSGFFKGTPFYGSWQERYDLTEKFKDLLDRYSNGRVVAPPQEWYTMDPEKYAKTFMEHGSSFHIAPPFYYRNDWGVTPLGA